MKKFLFALCAFALALPSVAADNNNIKMVTYFPVPYASYGDLGVTGTCDVGLMRQCKLDAGKSLTVAKASSDSRALNTGSIIVRKGTLGLNPASSLAAGTSITAGSGTGTGILKFSHDLAVTSISSSRLAKARAMNEAQLNSLNMYGHAFPTCDADDHEISWKSLTLGNKSGVFLVCGAGKEVEETCEQNPNQKKCCKGSNPYWNGSSCIRKCSTAGNSQWKRKFSNWYWGKLGSYTSSLSTTGGDCPDEEGSFDKVINKSGISRVCDSGTSWRGDSFSSDYVAQYLGLTCEQNALLDETEFECVYEAWSYNPNGNDCVAGVMKCQREEPETWTCPATQTCGTTKGSCK